MDSNFLTILFTGALVGATSGFLGSFMILKRMSLVGDALSHVALPGMAIALTFAINPMIGALVFLSAAIFGIWYLSEKTEVYTEALVGVFFTVSLAVGILITPQPELLEALFGSIENINYFDSVITVFASIFIFIITIFISKNILLGVVSEDLAKSQGVKISKVNLVYLLLVGLVVALGIKFVGTLLTGAMVIIPAAAAKNISKNIMTFQLVSVGIGVLSTSVGLIISNLIGFPSGPCVVLVSAGFFVLSYIFKVD